jgi:hypothetical protein
VRLGSAIHALNHSEAKLIISLLTAGQDLAQSISWGRRSLIETIIDRYKALIGPRSRACGLAAQQSEVAAGVAVVNRMLATRRPDFHPSPDGYRIADLIVGPISRSVCRAHQHRIDGVVPRFWASRSPMPFKRGTGISPTRECRLEHMTVSLGGIANQGQSRFKVHLQSLAQRPLGQVLQ